MADMLAQSSPFVQLQAGRIIIENDCINSVHIPSSGDKVVLQSGSQLPKKHVTISNSIITNPAGSTKKISSTCFRLRRIQSFSTCF
jgi:hypothetical protein